jgi:hypothetical protein
MQLQAANATLASLKYQNYDMSGLIDIALSVTNLKTNTLNSLTPDSKYEPEKHGKLLKIRDAKVCIKYQRKMRLVKLLDKLKANGGFSKEAAGHIDVAIRPNGEIFVWDGFRRLFLAALSGHETIPVSIFEHPQGRSIKECEEYEAKMFKIRNADSENMKPEELFRSMVVYRDTEALQFLDFLMECYLDVEGLNPGCKELSGMTQVQKCWKNSSITHKNLILSSKILRKTWNNDPTMSGYLLTGLGKFLDANENMDAPFDEQQIQELFSKYVNIKPPRKQRELTGRRLNKNPNASIAYCIATQVIGLEGESLVELLELLDLDKIDVNQIDFD